MSICIPSARLNIECVGQPVIYINPLKRGGVIEKYKTQHDSNISHLKRLKYNKPPFFPWKGGGGAISEKRAGRYTFEFFPDRDKNLRMLDCEAAT